MDAALGGGFFSLPWPNDIRRAADGTLELDGLPGVELLPGETPTPLRAQLPIMMQEIGESLGGFGVNTATYFESDLTLAPSSLPSPSASVGDRPTVVLLDLDHPGDRVPIIADFQATGDRNRPDNLLTVSPYPGHPLVESTRYAVAITRGVRTQSKQPLAPSQLLGQLDQPWDSSTGVDEADWDALREQRDDVRAALATETTWHTADLAAFTVFSTQDVDGDLQAVAGAAQAVAPPKLNVTTQGSFAAEFTARVPCGAMSQLGITTIGHAAGFAFYKFLDPDAVRTNSIQQVCENLQLLRAFGVLQLDGTTLGTAGTVGTDPTLQVLDELNPIVAVSQAMLEGGDGINYPSAVNYLNFAGSDDTCVPFETSRYFAGATGLPVHYADPPTSAYGDPAVHTFCPLSNRPPVPCRS